MCKKYKLVPEYYNLMTKQSMIQYQIDPQNYILMIIFSQNLKVEDNLHIQGLNQIFFIFPKIKLAKSHTLKKQIGHIAKL